MGAQGRTTILAIAEGSVSPMERVLNERGIIVHHLTTADAGSSDAVELIQFAFDAGTIDNYLKNNDIWLGLAKEFKVSIWFPRRQFYGKYAKRLHADEVLFAISGPLHQRTEYFWSRRTSGMQTVIDIICKCGARVIKQ